MVPPNGPWHHGPSGFTRNVALLILTSQNLTLKVWVEIKIGDVTEIHLEEKATKIKTRSGCRNTFSILLPITTQHSSALNVCFFKYPTHPSRTVDWPKTSCDTLYFFISFLYMVGEKSCNWIVP